MSHLENLSGLGKSQCIPPLGSTVHTKCYSTIKHNMSPLAWGARWENPAWNQTLNSFRWSTCLCGVSLQKCQRHWIMNVPKIVIQTHKIISALRISLKRQQRKATKEQPKRGNRIVGIGGEWETVPNCGKLGELYKVPSTSVAKEAWISEGRQRIGGDSPLPK